MSDKMPIVSVVMPAYNAARFIEEAINSVIAQTVSDWELIVIDDCSTDETFMLASKFSDMDSRIRVLQNDINLGVAKTRNLGIELARGQYVAFIDSDDAWRPEKLYKQLKIIQDENVGICYCSYAIVDVNGNKTKSDYLVPKQVRYKDIMKENCIQCSSMMIPIQIIKETMFNTEFYHEDYVLGLDILKKGYVAVADTDVLLNWRYLNNSRSFNKKKSACNRWRIYREYLKLPLLKAIYYFSCYAFAGIRKYGNSYPKQK